MESLIEQNKNFEFPDLELGKVTMKLPSELPNKRKQLLNSAMLPMAPTANTYWGVRVVHRKSGTAKQMRFNGGAMAIPFLSKSGAAYKEQIIEIFQTKKWQFLTEQPLYLDIVICPHSKIKQDLDNRIKSLFDALMAAEFMKDDSQIMDYRVTRGPTITKGRIIISAWEIIPDPAAAMARIGRTTDGFNL